MDDLSLKPGVETLGERHLRYWRAKLLDPCFVYVAQGPPRTPVKVGRAQDVEARLRVVQTGYPYRLRPVYVLPGNHELEWQLHQKLKPARMEGEWFGGPEMEKVLPFIADLAHQMVNTHDPKLGTAPSHLDFPGDWISRGKKEYPVTVRFVEPDPVPEGVAKQRVLEHNFRSVA